jgi:hypothetical protein
VFPISAGAERLVTEQVRPHKAPLFKPTILTLRRSDAERTKSKAGKSRKELPTACQPKASLRVLSLPKAAGEALHAILGDHRQERG